VVIGGLALQLALGLVILSPGVQQFFFTVVDSSVHWLSERIERGPDFLFQTLSPHAVLDASGKTPITVAGHASPSAITFAT
jgi:nucleoside permease NupC